MADWPSSPGRAADLGEVCRAAQALHRALRASVRDVRALLAEAAGPESEVWRQFEDLAGFLDRHFAKEEQILWPALEALSEAARHQQPRPLLPFPSLVHPVRLMEGEHVAIVERLAALREDLAGPGVASRTGAGRRRVTAALAALDAAAIDHVRFENEVLFPLALDVEHGLE